MYVAAQRDVSVAKTKLPSVVVNTCVVSVWKHSF